MKLVFDGTEISICSPQEVITFREDRESGKNFNFYENLSSDISANIAKIHKIHGYKNEEYSLGLLLGAGNELLFNYDFRNGYRFTFGPNIFPDYIHRDKDKVNRVIEFVLWILEAFGWIVTFNEDESWYYLDFAPLLALTPEEVNTEIEQRINSLAGKALQVINTGLVKHQSRFFRKEIGLAPANVLPEDVELVINRLSLLLGPKWAIANWNSFSFNIFPSTPS
ncbi:MAG: hypothetical protein UX01_C0010G0022 [Candidatus Collierbacteria bacterium GW2011_GWB2_45_17]|uniref:Uncharacterized protein n=1 Tax=Candidatus Collierbacteria bacterium GW2011_GWB2_45_17 TaxID=1618388 RepID=A0A837IDZ8_9BACT|nr:MAG: hypothetical protein UX01_C0010G0022 [Candidatus Collierbacteria bacterium GW2011_GWB2_45_17]HCX25482.1 hypothetical protein [Candidatus Collierbacteria bacterium]